MKILYTANGRYIRCCTEEGTRPVIIVCEKEYEVDVQELKVNGELCIFSGNAYYKNSCVTLDLTSI